MPSSLAQLVHALSICPPPSHAYALLPRAVGPQVPEDPSTFSLATRQILELYDALNNKNLLTVDSILTKDVFYHDLGLYNDPFESFDALKGFFTSWADFPEDVAIVPDDFTTDGRGSVSIVWHVE
eukprot:6574206-Pyramimonas_sp.AAC.1